MNCQRRRLQIAALLDGSPQREPEADLRAHLRGCPGCSRFLEEQSALDELLTAAALELEPPARLWKRIESRLETRPEGFREWAARSWGELFSLPQWRHALAGLALMAACSLALFNLPGGGGDAEVLAALDSYRIELPPNNPFLPQSGSGNPFFRVNGLTDGNPFEEIGSHR